MTTVAVIGAGVTGLTTAYELLDRGFEVTVFDRHRYAAMETSFANGGQLSASNAETWTQWGTVLKGLKWMLQADAPLLVNPRPTLHKIALDGRVPVEHPELQGEHRRDRAAGDRRARGALRDGGARGHRLRPRAARHPALLLDRQKDLAHARMVNGLLAEGGLVRRELSPAEIRAIEPALHGDFVGGFLTESDSSGDIHKFTVGLARGLRPARRRPALRHRGRRRGGGRRRGADQLGRRARRRSTAWWSSAGVRSRAIAAALGDRVNIYPVKGYSITVDLDDAESQAAAPWVSLLDDRAKIVASRFGKDRFRIAGTAEFNGANKRHPRRPHPAAGRVVREALPRHVDRACDALGGAAADDAVDAAAGRPRQGAGRLLQHRPRPPRLDAVGRDGPDRRRERRRRTRAARAAHARTRRRVAAAVVPFHA